MESSKIGALQPKKEKSWPRILKNSAQVCEAPYAAKSDQHLKTPPAIFGENGVFGDTSRPGYSPLPQPQKTALNLTPHYNWIPCFNSGAVLRFWYPTQILVGHVPIRKLSLRMKFLGEKAMGADLGQLFFPGRENSL